ncbi:hypothetical protein ABZ565_33010 [Streptomyces sp. NPDC016469]|uniref:hypothetical protein n=1 Tax=Streptomyces sp. NPDC016469 TaxID=3157191 RepID=UPI0033EA6F4C
MSTEIHPAPEKPFSIFDIAHAAVGILSGDWKVESGEWGVTASIFNDARSFCLAVDEGGDLCLDYDRPSHERLPDVLPQGVVSYGGGLVFEAACADEGLNALSAKVASAVRAATTGTPAPMREIPAPTTAMELGRAHATHGPYLTYPITNRLACHSIKHRTPVAAERMVSYLGFTLPACRDHKYAAGAAARELHELS